MLISLLLPLEVSAQDADAEPADEPAQHDDVIVTMPGPAPDPVVAPAPPAPTGPLVPPGGVPQVGPVQRTRPVPATLRPRPPPPPPIPPPRYSVELQLRLAFPGESSFDRAMTAFRYSGVRVEPVGYVGIQVPLVDSFWIGARYGMRGRQWTHMERDAASVSAGDLLATAQVRFSLGPVVELGVLLAGGVAFLNVQMNGVDSGQVVGRFGLEAILAFKIGPNFAFGPRFGWDYFQWEGLNRYDHGLDIGGGFLGFGLEGRE